MKVRIILLRNSVVLPFQFGICKNGLIFLVKQKSEVQIINLASYFYSRWQLNKVNVLWLLCVIYYIYRLWCCKGPDPVCFLWDELTKTQRSRLKLSQTADASQGVLGTVRCQCSWAQDSETLGIRVLLSGGGQESSQLLLLGVSILSFTGLWEGSVEFKQWACRSPELQICWVFLLVGAPGLPPFLA